MEFGIADPVDDRAKCGTGLDRLKLFGIADENKFRAGLHDDFDEVRHLPRRDHAGLVEDKHCSVVETVDTLCPTPLPRRKRARGDARFVLQALGRLPSESTADNAIPRRLPDLARRLHHCCLAGAGAANDCSKRGIFGQTFDRCLLLIRKFRAAIKSRIQNPAPHAMRRLPCKPGSAVHHLRFEPDKLPGRVPFRGTHPRLKVDTLPGQAQSSRVLQDA